jgi:ABC-type thiamin/hydroxymethylpyrimidine transport system permease subunit/DMSO/TMAO reductase YedYZ molybdopterin-dependent catalytic subunit
MRRLQQWHGVSLRRRFSLLEVRSCVLRRVLFEAPFSLSRGVGVSQRRTHFTTRDLLMMAALAAMGGVVSTYVNAVGDVFQSVFGFAGTTQWAAGLHVLWLTLAVGLTRKQGAGTITGLLKGGVELLTGNTHGLLVVLVDIVAGLLVDLGFLPFRNKDSLAAYSLAGGLAAASNVFVFQLFASVPADTLAYWALLLVAGVAFLSGVLFGGGLARGLLNALRRAGVVKDAPPAPMGRRAYPIFLVTVALIAAALTVFLNGALRGAATVRIGGRVDAPYDYPAQHGDLGTTTAEGTLRDATASYEGVPIGELVARAQPQSSASLLLVRATDGYAFFIGLDEVRENGALLLSRQGEGDEASYDVVGAQNSKAWVRGVSELIVVGEATLEVSGALDEPAPYDPDDWQFEMDSTRLDLGDGPRKLQGMPLGKVLAAKEPQAGAVTVVVHTGGEPVSLPLAEVLADDGLRIFTVIGEDDVTFALARMEGEVLATNVARIEVK